MTVNRASSATGWVRNPDGTLGWTWNPLTGCLNHTPDGLCLGGLFPCYAYKLANGRLRQRYLANTNFIDAGTLYEVGRLSDVGCRGDDPFYPRFWEERFLDIPEDWRTLAGIQRVKPRGIFVCDMGELFGDWIPAEWLSRIFTKFIQCPQHRFYLLTKQPQNLIKFSPFPENCWVGVTATNFGQWQQASNYLTGLEARVKYISFEPLLEDIGSHIYPQRLNYVGINWVIIGAQTKPYKPPEIEWVEEIVRACDKAGVPVFIKDNLLPLFKTEMGYLNKDWLRQEMPIEHGVKEV